MTARDPIRPALRDPSAPLRSGAAGATGPRGAEPAGRVFVLAVEGLEPAALEAALEAGELPHLAELRAEGGLVALEPQLPADPAVAWTAFDTGRNPGRTDVYGSLAREWARGLPTPRAATTARSFHPLEGYTANPYPLVDARLLAASSGLATFLGFVVVLGLLLRMRKRWTLVLALLLGGVGALAGYRLRGYLPAAIPRVERAMRAAPFWEEAAAAGVPTTVLGAPLVPDGPADAGAPLRALAGAAFPDARGGRGAWTLFHADPGFEGTGEASHLGGAGTRFHVAERNGRVLTRIYGPVDFTDAAGRRTSVMVAMEREDESVRVTLGHQTQSLRPGQWSEPYVLGFQLNPLLKMGAVVRAKLLGSGPEGIELLVGPLHIDPAAPPFWQPPSHPAEFARDLAEGGTFATCGFPLVEPGVLDAATLEESAEHDGASREALVARALEGFDGRLFVAVLDGPARRLRIGADPAPALARADRVAGLLARAAGPGDTVLVCSPGSLRVPTRALHLNNWLALEGLLAVRPGVGPPASRGLRFVDWSATPLYALGPGHLYLHVPGAGDGLPGGTDLLDEVAARLLALVDPRTGARVVSAVRRPAELFAGEYLAAAPDLVVTCAEGYAISPATYAAGFGLDAAGHAAPALVDWPVGPEAAGALPVDGPGVLLADRPLRPGTGSVLDLAPTILSAAGVAPPADVDGRSLLAP